MIGRVDPYTACWTLGVLAAWGLCVLIAAVFVSTRRHNKFLVAGSSTPPGGPAATGTESRTVPVASSPAVCVGAAAGSSPGCTAAAPGSSVGAPTVLPVGAPKNAGES